MASEAQDSELNRMKITRMIGASLVCAVLSVWSRDVSYEPESVSVEGVIRRQTYPGRPNYESVTSGDELETYWILDLLEPVDVLGGEKEELNVTERNIRNLQMVFDSRSGRNWYSDYKKLVGRKVVVSGQLFHAINAHHRTVVLIRVSSIKDASLSQ